MVNCVFIYLKNHQKTFTLKNKRFILLINIVLLVAVFAVIALVQKKPAEVKETAGMQKSTMKEDNAKCFECHANANSVKPRYIIDSVTYYKSFHYDQGCTMCHSGDYEKTPHNPELKKEEMSDCMDCHSDMEKYRFAAIDSLCGMSIHAKMKVKDKGGINPDGKDFKCISCHNAHNVSSWNFNDSLRSGIEKINFSNSMCYKCHGNKDKNDLVITDDSEISQKHGWLPNQKSHFDHLRCVECHTEMNSNVDEFHKILPKQKSLKDCNACHSANSTKLNNLYKNKKSEKAEKLGFENPEFTKNVNVIGNNHNRYTHFIGLAVLGIMFFVLSIHIIFRIIKRK